MTQEFFDKFEDFCVLRKGRNSYLTAYHPGFNMNIFIKCNVPDLKPFDMRPLKKVFLIGSKPETLHAEIKSLDRLKNEPYIINMLGNYLQGHAVFLFLEFPRSFDLGVMLNRQFHDAIYPHAPFYIAQIMAALESVHAQGLLYIDMKDDNIIIDSDGLIKLIDFGGCGTPAEVSEAGCRTFCSPLFAAPEVLSPESARTLRSAASDWWSFGVVVYMMLSGKRPFDEGTLDDLMDAILIPNEYGIYDLLSEGGALLVKKFLVKNAANRSGWHVGDLDQIRDSDFFRGIAWEKVNARDLVAPVVFDERYYRK